MSRDDYEVGFGRPPKHTRFVKGESGNKGRKKKRPEFQTEMVARIRDERIIINGVSMTMFELAFRGVVQNTIKRGSFRSDLFARSASVWLGREDLVEDFELRLAGSDKPLVLGNSTFGSFATIEPRSALDLPSILSSGAALEATSGDIFNWAARAVIPLSRSEKGAYWTEVNRVPATKGTRSCSIQPTCTRTSSRHMRKRLRHSSPTPTSFRKRLAFVIRAFGTDRSDISILGAFAVPNF